MRNNDSSRDSTRDSDWCEYWPSDELDPVTLAKQTPDERVSVSASAEASASERPSLAEGADGPSSEDTLTADALLHRTLDTEPSSDKPPSLDSVDDESLAGFARAAEPLLADQIASGPRPILMPVDQNRLAEAGLAAAAAQAQATGSEVVLLHVLTSAPTSSQPAKAARLADATRRGELAELAQRAESVDEASGDEGSWYEARALTHLNALASRLRAAGVAVSYRLRYGTAGRRPSSAGLAIVKEASRLDCSLVVLGASVRRGLALLLRGSVADIVTGAVTCPVLLVRPDVSLIEKTHPVRSFAEDAALAGTVAPRSLGSRTVPVSRVVGSVGRAAELDASFRLTSHSKSEEERYKRVRAGLAEGAALPAVKLDKLGYGYYVLDGHHRVAAARDLGMFELDAEVTEFVPLGDARAWRVFGERRRFEAETGLKRIDAGYPETYPWLTQRIEEFRLAERAESLLEAAREWELRVYRPVARRIRALGLGQLAADRRTTDVFVLVWEHRLADPRSGQAEIDWPAAVAALQAADELAGGPGARVA